jgi:hypothetical protein
VAATERSFTLTSLWAAREQQSGTVGALSCPCHRLVSHLERRVKSLTVRVEAINAVYLLHCFVLSGLFPSSQKTSLLQFIKSAVYAVYSSHPALNFFYGASLMLASGV